MHAKATNSSMTTRSRILANDGRASREHEASFAVPARMWGGMGD